MSFIKQLEGLDKGRPALTALTASLTDAGGVELGW